MHNGSRNGYQHDHTYFLPLFCVVKNGLLGNMVCSILFVPLVMKEVGNLPITKLEFNFVVGDLPEVFFN
jgi:hypothetical protein